jgi:hypothetical protein
MSRNGSGTYNLPAGNPVVTATTITSTWANSTLGDIATALTGSLAADGQTPATGNLNMNTNRIVNVVDPTLAQDAATKAYVDTNVLLKANNLSDVANATTSRTNLSAAKSGANSDITSITGLTTPLAVSQGGIGAATLTANSVVLGNGTSAVQTVAPSTAGNVLTSNGTTWTSATAGGVTSLNGQTGAITNTGFNAIGSYTAGSINSAATVNAGDTLAGSSLRQNTGAGTTPFGFFSGFDAPANIGQSGTWRAMAKSQGDTNCCGNIQYRPNLWVRIS